MKILVTGSNGQLGTELQRLASQFPLIEFFFSNSQELDITKEDQVESLFQKYHFDYCVNCAAYTAVDKAEEDVEIARLVNVNGPANLAKACSNNGTTLIHISTDFVFDGSNNTPYNENSPTQPLGVYGQTKLDGELAVEEIIEQHFIIRTSWLYSQFGNNFVKTMLRLGEDRDELNVIVDQIGTPTNAVDLANAIIHIISTQSKAYGVYHFSNEGVASWYDFAITIFELGDKKIKVNAIPTSEYPTPAERPHYSVLDKTKIKQLGVAVPDWKNALKLYFN
ncbi:dTDP-4-dehydrorhamnose reductase [bacterium]|nr:dTDP-4-dehydrorhamnose reductase [bacterium]